VNGEDSPPILSEEKADGRFWLIVWCYVCREWSASTARIAIERKAG
jgi:hypothetical protein